jgi:cellobiose-specific phosphotransferase system component IIC
MIIKVPDFVPKTIKRRFFIAISWAITIISLGLVRVDLKDADGFEYKTN